MCSTGKRKLDEIGNIKVVERNVLVVLEKLSKATTIVVTKHEQQHLKRMKHHGPQLNMFDSSEHVD